MAEINGGGLHFESTLDNDKLNRAIDETMRRIQGLSDGTTTAGEVMEGAFEEAAQMGVKMADMIEGASAEVQEALHQINQAQKINVDALEELESSYRELGVAMEQAAAKGNDSEVTKIKTEKEAIEGEITVRKQLVAETEEQRKVVEAVSQKIEEQRKKVEQNTNAQNSLRTQIRNVRDEMGALRNEAEKNGVTLDENTGRYAELRDELGRLYTIQTDMQKQATVLSNAQQKRFQGIISGLSGLAGGFSAATGTISLFAGKNDDLQKIMTRVQSVMAITIGLQQVSQTLYKDSAFQLVTVAKAKKMLTSATNGLSTALGISNVAAKALMATLTLGLSLAITGIIVLTEKYISKTKAAKKEQEEFFKAVSEGVYKPIGAIQMLSEKWNQLGDNLEAKKKFIDENKKSFDDLGWAVKGVEDAERILSSPEHLQRFIDAQMAKARAMIYTEQAYENLKKQIELRQKLDETPEFTTVRTGGGAVGSYETPAKNWRYKQIEDELNKLNTTITKGYADAIEQEKLGTKILKEIGVESAEAYAEGSIGALQNAIKEKNDLLVKATSEPERAALRKEIDAMQKEVERMTGKGGSKSTEKDPFSEMLRKRKEQYDEYAKFLNSTDEEVRNSAKETFADILKDGGTYLDYLKKQKQQITGDVKSIGEEMKQLFGQGNVDLLSRPLVDAAELVKKGWEDAGEGIATVFSSQFGIIDSGGSVKEILITPILPDGTVLSPEELEDYIYGNLEGAQDILKADEKGIVIAVDVDPDGEAGEKLHQLQELYYGMGLSDKQLENLKKINSAIASETQKETNKEEEKQREHVKKLIEDYGKYYDQRVKLHEEYLKDIELLNKQLETETDTEKKAMIQTSIDNRTKTYEKDLKAAGTGDPEYDAMLKEYATFEQKKQAIIDDYAEKRKVAQEKGNTELIEQLSKAQAKALSSLATDELTGSEMWASLFGNMDELTISQIDTLLNEIESRFDELSGVFDPIDLNAVRTKLNEARAVLIQDNPFKAIGDSLKQIFSEGAGESKDAARNIKTDWKNLASATQSAFDFVKDVVDSADFLKDAIGDVGATAISSLATIATVSIAVSTAIKTAEKASVILTIIQAALAVVQAVANVITSIIRQKDKQIEKQIKKHAENVDNLQRSYENLEKAIDKALGSGRYTDTQKAIKNLEQQQKELAKQADLERSKKKTDKDKVREYENALQDAKDKQKELIAQLREDILGIDARSAAQELGAAFVDAFREGEDALEALGKKADDIVGNIMQKMLVQKLLEQPLGQIFDKYSKKWYSDTGDFIGFDAVIKDANAMGSEIKGVGEGFSKAMENLPDEIKKYFTGEAAGSDANSWVGAIKGASEESVKYAAGQINAMRINQLEATNLFRQQLAHLSTIAQNTAYNRYLKSIDERFARLENKPDTLRSQGLS